MNRVLATRIHRPVTDEEIDSEYKIFQNLLVQDRIERERRQAQRERAMTRRPMRIARVPSRRGGNRKQEMGESKEKKMMRESREKELLIRKLEEKRRRNLELDLELESDNEDNQYSSLLMSKLKQASDKNTIFGKPIPQKRIRTIVSPPKPRRKTRWGPPKPRRKTRWGPPKSPRKTRWDIKPRRKTRWGPEIKTQHSPKRVPPSLPPPKRAPPPKKLKMHLSDLKEIIRIQDDKKLGYPECKTILTIGWDEKDADPGKGRNERLEKGEDYFALNRIKDWRKKLTDTWVVHFELDGLTWPTLLHYIEAQKFKGTSFMREFSVESGSKISKNATMAKYAGSNSGKYKNKQIRPPHIQKVKGYNAKKVRDRGATAQFSQNTYIRLILLDTNDACLFIKKGKNRHRATWLEKIREKMRLI